MRKNVWKVPHYAAKAIEKIQNKNTTNMYT